MAFGVLGFNPFALFTSFPILLEGLKSLAFLLDTQRGLFEFGTSRRPISVQNQRLEAWHLFEFFLVGGFQNFGTVLACFYWRGELASTAVDAVLFSR